MTKVFIGILILLLFFNCSQFEIVDISELHLKKSNSEIEIIIDGYISTIKKIHYVKLSKPQNFYILDSVKPVSGAIVYITEGENIYNYKETAKYGLYASEDSIKGTIGKNYTVFVYYNNKTYSASDSLIEVEPFDFTKITLPELDNNSTNESMYFIIKRHEFGFDKPSMWYWESIPNTFQYLDIELFYGQSSNPFNYYHYGAEPQGIFSDEIFSHSIGSKPTDTITVAKFSISEKYYNYCLSVFNETDWKTGYFSTIPGNTLTNVSNGGTGYFFATDIYINRIILSELKKMVEENNVKH
jgi:hypothetical protein